MSLPPRIGRYRVLQLLGRGAMGVVYRARDEGLDRDVAVKVIRGEALDDDSRVQFLKEARAAARLQHPGIVTVYELGEQDGAPFLAMELLEGQDLQRTMQKGLVSSPERALTVVEQVLHALGHAHSRGIVHRDMKPSNVFLHAGAQAKILDFGVARLGGGLTATGRIVGTPHYMSPEQVRAEPVDGRTDLFSTALVFYEMVTGAKCYRPGSAVSVMYQIVHEDADLSRLPETPVGVALRGVLRRALARDRSARFADASSLLAGLAEAVRAHPPPSEPTPRAGAGVTLLEARAPGLHLEDLPLVASPDLDLPLAPEPASLVIRERDAGRRAWLPVVIGSLLVAGGAWWWLARPLREHPAPAPIGSLPQGAPSPTTPRPTADPSIEEAAASPDGPSASPAEPASPLAVPPAMTPVGTAPPVTTMPDVGSTARPGANGPPAATRVTGPPIPRTVEPAEARLLRAERLFESVHLRAALAEARAVLRDHPGNTQAAYLADDIELDLTVEEHLRKAREALAHGDRATARQEAEAGLRIKPNESRLTALLRELGGR